GHAMVEICAFEDGEQAFHGHRDGGVLNKLDVQVKHLRRLTIQPEDEAAHDLEALRLQGVDRMERILRVVFAHILFLFSGDERCRGWRLNTHEYLGKNHPPHAISYLVYSPQNYSVFFCI